MEERVGDELGRIARGGLLSIVGLLTSATLAFLTRTLVGRVFGPAQYGSYSLSLTVFSIALTLAMFGLPTAFPRQVSYFLRREREVVESLVWTTVVLAVITSTVTAVVLLPVAGFLANTLTTNPSSGELLRSLLSIAAIGIPFAALTNVLIALAQGYKRVREYVYYGKVGFPLLYFTLATAVTFAIGDLRAVIGAYVLAYMLVFTLLSRDIRRAGILPGKPRFSPNLARGILLFSIPLLTSNIISMVMTWTDSLMLGHFLGTRAVGIYTAASPLARFITMTVVALMTIYTPIVTEFFAEGRIGLVQRFYLILAKWSVLVAFPLIFILVNYPSQVIGAFFGGSYIEAAKPLVILSLGFAFVVAAGPAVNTLVTLGRTTDNMKGDLLGALTNVVLNYVLIGKLGMTGAALATLTSYIITVSYKLGVLLKSGIVPYSRRNLLLIVDAALIILVFKAFSPGGLLGALALTLVASVIFYGTAVLLGVLEEEDVFSEKLRISTAFPSDGSSAFQGGSPLYF